MKISEELKNYNLIYDRFPDQKLSLTYGKDLLLIQPNDTVSSDLVNMKLQYLHENFLYLYSKCKIASSVIPVSSTAVLGLSAPVATLSGFTWNYNLSTSQFFPATGFKFNAFNNSKVCYSIKNNFFSTYSLFVSDGVNIIIFSVKDDEQGYTLSPAIFSTYDPQKQNDVPFVNISSITDGPNNTFLILDQGTNMLYQYHAGGFIDNTNAYNNSTNSEIFTIKGAYVKNMVGGYGLADEKLSFNNPTDVVTYNNFIYVLDTGNRCIKKFDANLNWQTTFLLERDFYYFTSKKLKVDSSGNFYCLLSGNTIHIYDQNFQNKTEYIPDFFNSSEQLADIQFSKSDKNIVYLITNENVYKCLVNNLENTIGRYLLYRYGYNNTQNISSFCTHDNFGNDKNFILSNNPSSNATIIGAFADNINTYDNLTIPDFDIYSFDEIKINSDEYVQSWVINKSLAKIIANHIRFINQITGKFQFSIDYRGNAIFEFTRYLTTTEKANLLQKAEEIL